MVEREVDDTSVLLQRSGRDRTRTLVVVCAIDEDHFAGELLEELAFAREYGPIEQERDLVPFGVEIEILARSEDLERRHGERTIRRDREWNARFVLRENLRGSIDEAKRVRVLADSAEVIRQAQWSAHGSARIDEVEIERTVRQDYEIDGRRRVADEAELDERVVRKPEPMDVGEWDPARVLVFTLVVGPQGHASRRGELDPSVSGHERGNEVRTVGVCGGHSIERLRSVVARLDGRLELARERGARVAAALAVLALHASKCIPLVERIAMLERLADGAPAVSRAEKIEREVREREPFSRERLRFIRQALSNETALPRACDVDGAREDVCFDDAGVFRDFRGERRGGDAIPAPQELEVRIHVALVEIACVPRHLECRRRIAFARRELKRDVDRPARCGGRRREDAAVLVRLETVLDRLHLTRAERQRCRPRRRIQETDVVRNRTVRNVKAENRRLLNRRHVGHERVRRIGIRVGGPVRRRGHGGRVRERDVETWIVDHDRCRLRALQYEVGLVRLRHRRTHIDVHRVRSRR